MQTTPSRSATLPYKHSASRPCWHAATPTTFALPQTSATAAPRAMPGGGVATRPVAWGRPPPLRHPPPPLDAEAARMATGNNGLRRGRRRKGSPPRAACSSASTWHSGSLTGLRAREGGAADPTIGPQRATCADDTRHAREPPQPPPLLKPPYSAPRHATLPRSTALPPPYSRRCAAPRPRLDSTGTGERPPRTCRPPSATAAANASDSRARVPPALGACGGRTRASGGRRVRPCADCG